MNRKLVQLTKDLIKFETVEGNYEAKKGIVDFVRKEFDGCDVSIRELKSRKSPSLVITLGKEKDPAIILSGHLDVVPSEKSQFVPRIKDGKLYGRGAGDMKAADAVMIEAMKYFSRQKEKPSLGMMLTSDEETGGMHGTKVLLEKMNPKLAIVPDGGRTLQKVILSQKGLIHFKVWAEGRSCHGSTPFLGENAIEKIISFHQEMKKIIPPSGQHEWRNTFNLGKISGGEVINKVPDYAEAYFDVRVVDEKEKHKILEHIGSIAENFEIMADAFALAQEPNELSEFFRKIIEEKIGREVIYSKTGGASDARFFSEKGAIILITAIECENIHAKGEWVNIEQIGSFYEILIKFIKEVSDKI